MVKESIAITMLFLLFIQITTIIHNKFMLPFLIMNNIKQIVEDELIAVDKELDMLLSVEDEVYKELKDFINSPQKRIRSLCAILYFKSVKADINQEFIDVLTIGELIHNASLLHDDVIDNSPLRRGKLTIGAKYTPQIAILSGDLLLSIATDKLIRLENFDILRSFQQCTREMSEAEIQQYFLRGKIPSIEEYVKIAEGKTASLFEAIFKSLSNITKFDIAKAENFAKNFGVLFQLKNDLERSSAQIDKKNKIFTPKDILGIEKTNNLMDNYLEDIRRDLEEFPDSEYKKGLRDLLKNL